MSSEEAIKVDDRTHVPLIWLAVVSVFLMSITATGSFFISALNSDVIQVKSAIADEKKEKSETDKFLRRLDRTLLKVQLKMGITPEPEDVHD